jgi:hypothetical protein
VAPLAAFFFARRSGGLRLQRVACGGAKGIAPGGGCGQDSGDVWVWRRGGDQRWGDGAPAQVRSRPGMGLDLEAATRAHLGLVCGAASLGYPSSTGDFVCGHRVPWHRLTGTFVACNRCHLKSWIGNSSEGPFRTNVGQTKYCRDFSRSRPIAVPHVSISLFHVSSSVSIYVAIRCNGVTPQRCTVKI